MPRVDDQVGHVVSILKGKSGAKKLPDLERDMAQRCANILDAVGSFTLWATSPI